MRMEGVMEDIRGLFVTCRTKIPSPETFGETNKSIWKNANPPTQINKPIPHLHRLRSPAKPVKPVLKQMAIPGPSVLMANAVAAQIGTTETETGVTATGNPARKARPGLDWPD